MLQSHDNLLIYLVCLVSVAVSFRVSTAFGDGREMNTSASIDKLFENWNRPDAPGFAVSVILNGKSVHKRGYGMANLDANMPITSKTSFDVMSLAKSFTTAGVARLLDQGVLSPDTDVRTFVPELPEYDPPVTIRHLLTCRSGLRDFYHLMILLGRSEQDAYTKADVLDVISRQKAPVFPPGTRFAYSNSDFFLLALVIERASGKSYRSITSELLFEPLGMKHTFFDDDEALPRRNRAIGHSRFGKGPWRRYGLNSSTVGPWRLMTTLDDMLLWDASFKNNKLPAGRHLDAFHRTGSLFNNEKCLSAFPKRNYKGLKRVWYTGGGLGFHAHFIRFPDHGLSIVAFGNVSTAKAWDDMARTLPKVADLYLAGAVDSTVPDEAWLPDGARDADLTEKQMQEIGNRMIGTYRSSYGYFVRVSSNGRRLRFQWLFFDYALQDPEPLVVVAPNRLRTSRGYNEFELILVGNGRERSEIQIKYPDGRKETWNPVEFGTLDSEQMAKYAGDYHCTDLDSVYRVSAFDGKLFVQMNYGRKRRLLPTVADTFKTTNERFNGMIFTFSRNELGDITGFSVDFDRIRDLRFQKRLQMPGKTASVRAK